MKPRAFQVLCTPSQGSCSFQEIFKGLQQTVSSPHSQKEGNCQSPPTEKQVLGAPSQTMQVTGGGGVAPDSYLLFPHIVEAFFKFSQLDKYVMEKKKAKIKKESAETLTFLW